MGIEQNFNKNLKKSVKDQMPSLPTNSKFIFQQLLKNSHHIEENLKDETMLEINVGDLKKVLSERKWCSRRKLGKSCDGGDGHGAGVWTNTANGCQCSYGGMTYDWMEVPPQSNDVKHGSVSTNSDGVDDLESVGREREMEEVTSTASSGAYVTPRFWAKKKRKKKKKVKSRRKSKSNGKRLMPGAKYVKVKDKCKKFPYCNQGDIGALEIWEKEIMRESAKNVAKKTGKSESEVREMIEKELAEIIRRGFYKSPVTDLVGGGKMKTPIGKIFNMNSPNVGPKYES